MLAEAKSFLAIKFWRLPNRLAIYSKRRRQFTFRIWILGIGIGIEIRIGAFFLQQQPGGGFCAMPKFMASHLPASKVRTLRSGAAGGAIGGSGGSATVPGVGHATGRPSKPGATPMSQQQQGQQLDFDLWHSGANINQPATAHSQGRHHTTTTKGSGPTRNPSPCTEINLEISLGRSLRSQAIPFYL